MLGVAPLPPPTMSSYDLSGHHADGLPPTGMPPASPYWANNTATARPEGSHNPGAVSARSVTPSTMNVSRDSGPATYYRRGADDSFSAPTGGVAGSGAEPENKPNIGLIRLTLRKPMGIVFEPMMDPHNPSQQRGVRICDLPRTGSAALSRKLEVGDELLSINDKTMSRLTFDEIMDYIIEADPDQVRLLFRRPKTFKSTASSVAPSAMDSKMSSQMGPSAGANANTVKWVDDNNINKSTSSDHDRKKSSSKKSSSKSRYRDDNDTVTEASVDSSRYNRNSRNKNRGRDRRSNSGRRHPYDNESFLDTLIDTLCSPLVAGDACKDRGGRRDYYSDEEDDDRTFNSHDDSTYVTYDDDSYKPKNKSRRRKDSDYSSDDDETLEDKKKNRKSKKKDTYEDDATLETVETLERAKDAQKNRQAIKSPLGLSPHVDIQKSVSAAVAKGVGPDESLLTSNVPIKDLEFDDNGADVSVMESLGGPSLLVENYRQNAAVARGAAAASSKLVSREITDQHGLAYPTELGLSREETIQRDPLKFYKFVVKDLLQEHEPEKVRLLDKLMAKYKTREEHLVQKLSARYKANEDTPTIQEENDDDNDFGEKFASEVVNKRDSAATSAAIQKAAMRLQGQEPQDGENSPSTAGFDENGWPDDSKSKVTTGTPGGDDDESIKSEGSESFTSGTDFSSDSLDGTSPAVIAQVSELLNYVYGKTSVPGQIDRVSTIMRAYEGREAVLLELLETKALIKANTENDEAANLPASLRNSAGLNANNVNDEMGEEMVLGDNSAIGPNNPLSPMSGMSGLTSLTAPGGGFGTPTNNTNGHHDDVSQLSEIEEYKSSTPGGNLAITTSHSSEMHFSGKGSYGASGEGKGLELNGSSPTSLGANGESPRKGKKKGFFGGLFGKKGKGGFPTSDGNVTSSTKKKKKKGALLNPPPSSEASI